jgi:hypothetical protein
MALSQRLFASDFWVSSTTGGQKDGSQPELLVWRGCFGPGDASKRRGFWRSTLRRSEVRGQLNGRYHRGEGPRLSDVPALGEGDIWLQ